MDDVKELHSRFDNLRKNLSDQMWKDFKNNALEDVLTTMERMILNLDKRLRITSNSSKQTD